MYVPPINCPIIWPTRYEPNRSPNLNSIFIPFSALPPELRPCGLPSPCSRGLMTAEAPKKTGPSQIVKLNNAFKLAEEWVSGSAEDEALEVEPEGRPDRLGLGAKVPRQSKVEPFNNHVERKLYAKLNAARQNSSKNTVPTSRSAGDVVDEGGDYDDSESRSSAFVRKRAVPSTLQL